MKYIDAEKLIAEIESIRLIPQTSADYNDGRDDMKMMVLDLIDSLQQEQPKLTQVPRIEQEIQKKGWMNYSLLISEIGLYRSNAIDRIKETKERAAEIKRNIAPHDLAILGKYLESVGAEIVLCCLQQYCMDFMFTQDEVKVIIQHEQPDVELEKEMDKFYGMYRDKNGKTYAVEDDEPCFDWKEDELSAHDMRIARHFWDKGYNARRNE